jgi:hypothetical protein
MYKTYIVIVCSAISKFKCVILLTPTTSDAHWTTSNDANQTKQKQTHNTQLYVLEYRRTETQLIEMKSEEYVKVFAFQNLFTFPMISLLLCWIFF